MVRVAGVKNREKQQFPYGIKPPKTLEEFRTNLKKYYLTIEDGKGNVGLNLMEKYIRIDEISSLYDLYNHCREEMESGLYKNVHGNTSPSLTPMISIKKDFGDYMKETKQSCSTYGYFFDENNFTLYEDEKEMLNNPKDMVWIKIDNQIYREFFMITLGEFSGYEFTEGDTFNETTSHHLDNMAGEINEMMEVSE